MICWHLWRERYSYRVIDTVRQSTSGELSSFVAKLDSSSWKSGCTTCIRRAERHASG